ncbi:hypothetical protein DYB36_002504 [Aphanomyces astaci]|uniref:F-box domain-containing protein n=2 Tax=Aphanomyces astaci TaxID=112090 RepID=A0A396ZR21_APHAT|nr:hypothetical protein DYB36_002504 [Aphanomyces astaci]
MVRPVGKAARRAKPPNSHPRNLPPPLIQLIATFLPADSFFNYLRAFQWTHSLGDLRHFLTLVNEGIVDASDVWPELHLRWVDAANVNKFHRMAKFVSVVHAHDGVFDLDWLERILTPANALALQAWPSDVDLSIPIQDWGPQLARRMRVSHLSFADFGLSGGSGGGHMVTLLPELPHLRSLNVEELDAEFVDDVFDFVCCSKLTRLTLGSYSVPVVITTERALALTMWLKREPVHLLELNHCSFEEGAHLPTIHRLLDAVCRSPMESLVLTNMTFDSELSTWQPIPIASRRVTFESTPLSDTQAALLFRGLCKGATTHLHVNDMKLTLPGMASLSVAIADSPLQVVTVELTTMDGEGWGCVAKAIARSKHLRELYLLRTGLLDCDVAYIANALVNASSVRVVHVVGNAIRFAGAVALVQCLGRRRHALDELKMEGLAVSEDEAAVLQSMADGFPMLKRCVVTTNVAMHVAMQSF